MTLGKRIGMLRKEKKISQESVAESLGVSRQAVSKWENDLTVPDMENLIALAKLLGVDVEYLASGELTEEMISEPIPEPVPAPRRRKDPQKLLCVLLALFLITTAVLGWLLYREQNDYQELELLCSASAYQCCSSLRSYQERGSDGDYWLAVADFRTFQQTLKVLIAEEAAGPHVSSSDYAVCNQIYGFMIHEPERVQRYLNELIAVVDSLSGDIYGISAYQRLYELRSLLEHGE